MSPELPNISYYDSSGQGYGFTKPYSEDTAKLIDKEVNRLIAEQYARAKKILLEKAEGHHALTSILLEREVIFTEDVEKIFGKRQWSSRTEEIMEAEEKRLEDEKRFIEEKSSETSNSCEEEKSEEKNVEEEEVITNNILVEEEKTDSTTDKD